MSGIRDSANHHPLLTLLFAFLVVGLTLIAFYAALTSHNPTAMIAALPAALTSLTTLHAAASAVAASPNTPAYGVHNPPPLVSIDTTTPAPVPPPPSPPQTSPGSSPSPMTPPPPPQH